MLLLAGVCELMHPGSLRSDDLMVSLAGVFELTHPDLALHRRFDAFVSGCGYIDAPGFSYAPTIYRFR